MLFALISTKKDAEGRGQVVGDIRPENVFLSPNEDVKIATMNSFPNEKPGYAKMMDELSPSYKVMLAPEDLECARISKVASINNEKGDIFSIGATVIGAGILDDMSSIYDYPNRKFNYEVHSQKTSAWL